MPAPALSRRNLLRSASAATLGTLLLDALPAFAQAPTPLPGGGEFAFLAGEWRIANRYHRRRPDGTYFWDEFPGEATVRSVLAGNGSIEELRIPARNFGGLGVRLYDGERRAWKDSWVDGQQRVVGDPVYGTFENGAGTFIADDANDGHPTKSRGIWDRITPTSCRWYSSISRDAGATWEDVWYMAWTRMS
jgi:hypothetical protein